MRHSQHHGARGRAPLLESGTVGPSQAAARHCAERPHAAPLGASRPHAAQGLTTRAVHKYEHQSLGKTELDRRSHLAQVTCPAPTHRNGRSNDLGLRPLL